MRAARELMAGGLTMSMAESCSGGLASHLLTNVPGVSSSLMETVVSYSNRSKVSRLGVPAGLIERHGAVSRKVAMAMARGVRRCCGSDLGLAITGIAGPGGGSPRKPVGLVFVAVSSARRLFAVRFLFRGTRVAVKNAAVCAALTLLAREACTLARQHRRRPES
jgi:nicotinamide-nucleotide amidase